ncbi:glycosyltransferase family 4 protein [Halanaerobium congolense]|uniref:Glycosyltransferase involved in cell wall bisynthesis n=1 Tax=Halanaerobium congolense TaxID=54121 RepID=A0A1G6SPN3_9FIRM|nr:glycosyltransferase family 4 protein [Halanaerobium congolense]SDD18852.1 Glycosyltransferase involved in cell wall bisynthesis [Halanaerobium congolense]
MREKILVINQHFYPEFAATGQLLEDLCADLAQDYEVTVLTGKPSYVGSIDNIPKEEIYRGIDIIRVFNTSFSKTGKLGTLGRIINYLTFYLLVFFKGLTLKKYDTIIVLSTPPYISLVALALKLFKKSKIIYVVQDLYPEVAIELDIIKSNFLISFFKKINKFILKRVDKIVTIGEHMQELLEKSYGKKLIEEKSKMIYNWADGEKIYPISKDQTFRKKWGLEDTFVIMYSGNMGNAHEFDTVLEAAENLKHEDQIKFLFVGEGVKKEYIEEYISENNLDNFVFKPYQDKEDLIYSLNTANLSLTTLNSGFEGLVVPSKVYGIMASGKPIIFISNFNNEISDMIENHQIGYNIKIGNSDKLAAIIKKYKEDRDLLKKHSQNTRKLFEEEFNKEISIEKYRDLLKDLDNQLI